MIITPEKFLQIVRNAKEEKHNRLGKIDTEYLSGRPRIIFDGETTVSTKQYPYLASYSPVAGDRVILEKVGGTYVVMGKIE